MSFGSPACDYVENSLDLNRFLISHPVATYFMKMQGDALKNAGIFNGDILVVDRSLPAADRRLIAPNSTANLPPGVFAHTKAALFCSARTAAPRPTVSAAKTAFRFGAS